MKRHSLLVVEIRNLLDQTTTRLQLAVQIPEKHQTHQRLPVTIQNTSTRAQRKNEDVSEEGRNGKGEKRSIRSNELLYLERLLVLW